MTEDLPEFSIGDTVRQVRRQSSSDRSTHISDSFGEEHALGELLARPGPTMRVIESYRNREVRCLVGTKTKWFERQSLELESKFPKLNNLRKIAAYINNNPHLGLRAYVSNWFESTSYKPAGFRYITRVGKGRHGLLLEVRGVNQEAMTPALYRHNSAETYRTNSEPLRWLVEWEEKLRTEKR